MKKRAKKTQEETPMEEKSTLHIKDAYDYQGTLQSLYDIRVICILGTKMALLRCRGVRAGWAG